MEGEIERMELLSTRLYDAALHGDVPSLLNLLHLDPLLLDRATVFNSGRCRFTHSPLHIAATLGHLDFAAEILRQRPRLAHDFDLDLDRGSPSPMHLSAANGHLQIVKALAAANPGMCLARDQDGRNPVHVAAMRGQTHVLGELLQVEPQAAVEVTTMGESVLHVCVKYRQIDALKLVVKVLDDGQLLNSKDPGGNTVLHLAVATTQIEMVNFLLEDPRMDINAINANGSTAMDICQKKAKNESVDAREILTSLKNAKALQSKAALRRRDGYRTWSDNQHNALMVVASLLATMAFQVGINPPGGVWQETASDHTAGGSIMAARAHEDYVTLLVVNSIALISSLVVILLLISRLRYNWYFVSVLIVVMWIAVSATMWTYVLAISYLLSPASGNAPPPSSGSVGPRIRPFSAPSPGSNAAASSTNWKLPSGLVIIGVSLLVTGLILFGRITRCMAKLNRRLVELVRQVFVLVRTRVISGRPVV